MSKQAPAIWASLHVAAVAAIQKRLPLPSAKVRAPGRIYPLRAPGIG